MPHTRRAQRLRIGVTLVLLALALAIPQVTRAAVFDVGCNADPAARVAALIAAFSAANATPEQDTITLAAGCVYTLTQVNNTGNGQLSDNDGIANGLPQITTSMVIIGNGARIERSAAADTPAFRFFSVMSGATLRIDRLTLRNGLATLPADIFQTVEGGAIRVVYSHLELTNSVIESNMARGSALSFPNTHKALPADAGGIGLRGSGTTARIVGTSIISNTAIGGDNGTYSSGGDAVGAGITVQGGSLQLINSTLSGNQARVGRGIAGSSKAIAGGGGIFYGAATVQLMSVTITNNSADGSPSAGISVGGGISANGNFFEAFNSIIVGNRATFGTDCDTKISGASNLYGSAAECGTSGPPQNGEVADVTTLLAPLANNGGEGMTHALLPGSRGVDASKIDLVKDFGALVPEVIYDQRGLLRDAHPDIGAFERGALNPSITPVPTHTCTDTPIATTTSTTTNTATPTNTATATNTPVSTPIMVVRPVLFLPLLRC